MLHLALFYEPIDLWLADDVTDDVTVRPHITDVMDLFNEVE
jgi:hypothetical protein